VWAGVSLPAEPADEERLQCGGQSGHRETSLAAWVRWLVRANSSGMAVKYPLFRARNNGCCGNGTTASPVRHARG
jgi:hypothetical protein